MLSLFFIDTLRGQLENIIAFNSFFLFLLSPLLSLPFLFCAPNKYWYLHGDGILNDTMSFYSEHNLLLSPHKYYTNLFLMHRNMLFFCSVSPSVFMHQFDSLHLTNFKSPTIYHYIHIWFHIFILSLPCIKLQCQG